METSLKEILCYELTTGILSTLSEIQSIWLNTNTKNTLIEKKHSFHMFHFWKQLKIFQFKYQRNVEILNN